MQAVLKYTHDVQAVLKYTHDVQTVLKYTQDGSPDSPTRTLRKPLFGLPIVSLESLWGWLAASFV